MVRGFLLVALVGLWLLSSACIEDEATGVDGGSTVAEVISADAGSVVRVNGWLLGGHLSVTPPRLCTELRRPSPYVFECVEPSIPVLVNMDMVDGVRRVDAFEWVDEVIQFEGVIVRQDGREPELDVYGCVQEYTERCSLPPGHQGPR